MQISRLFETVYILLNRRHVTAKELAERFEVSVRTVYRDIEALSQAGVPVYATQGAGGGIHISDAYVLNKSTLSDMEQNEILLALQSLSVTGHTDSDRLLSRLGSLFNKESADWIEVDFSRWGSAAHDRELLATIKTAILQRRLVSFTYHGFKGARTDRTIQPIKLIYKSHAWYVQAFCLARDDYRTFKLIRMSEINLSDVTFDRQSLSPPPPFGEMETWDGPVNCVPVDVRFSACIAWRVLDEFDASMITWEDDGSLTVRGFFSDDFAELRHLLSYGAMAEVISPPQARAFMKATLEATNALYSDS